MRVGTVFHRTDDDKVDADMLFENKRLKIVCYLALGATWLQKLRHLSVHAINGLRCLAQFIDLRWVLGRKELSQCSVGEHPLSGNQTLQLEEVICCQRCCGCNLACIPADNASNLAVDVIAVVPAVHLHIQLRNW